MIGKNSLTDKFKNNLEQMRQVNLPAYNFMNKLLLQEPYIWLSTVKNAHVYFGNKFLVYIIFKNTDITLNSQFNRQIHVDTEDASNLLFPSPLFDLLNKYQEFKQYWVIKNELKPAVTIQNKMPEIFFEELFKEILKIAKIQSYLIDELQNYWWFGINNSKNNKGHVNYLEIAPFLNQEQSVFHWRYGGSSYSKKFYPQLKVGDRIVFWMGHGDFELWGIIGFGYISKINLEEKLVDLQLIDTPKIALTPYPKNNPQETKEVLFLKELFGLEFYALRDVFYQLKYVTQRTTPVTIDKITSIQYEKLLDKLTLFTEELIKFFPEEIENDKKEQFYEGAVKQITVNSYERDVKARQKCIEIYGLNCVVCGFNFEEKYGEFGKNFIHIHHLNPLSEIKEEYIVDPKRDLRPVCPNCHAMLHRKKDTLSIEELKDILSLKDIKE